MILKNGKIFSEGLLREGAILINNGKIVEVKFTPDDKDLKILIEKNQDNRVIDCKNKLILPGIIDIHSHLRDMGQTEKETFFTGTKAAAYSGITTVFNMPNTKPPAISGEQVQKWMDKAQNSINVDVGFIAGVPKEIDENEIQKIIKLGVIGFKIYPLNPLNDINWKNSENIQKILTISSRYQIPLFIHPAFPISDKDKDRILSEFKVHKSNTLALHDKLNPVEMEEEFIHFIIENYKKCITNNNLNPESYPIVHLCHVSCIKGYLAIQMTLKSDHNFKITFEITPHHLLLSHDIKLNENNYGKVLPPLRSSEHSKFLFNELKEGNVSLIGTDHAPHTLKEKSHNFFDAPSGFPGFETYPLMMLHRIFTNNFSLENFVKISSENPAKIFNLEKKGSIRKGYDADLIIIDKVSKFPIKSQKFKTKAKYSPFENCNSTVLIWKVFLRGTEINNENNISNGKIIKANYKV
ncbi:MAG: dihydroorotase family protein [Candidatus Thorarchaeota archaeon]